LLILLFGVHPASAVGTDLLFAAATKTGGTLVHGLVGTVDWRVVGLLASGSMPTAVLTLTIVSRIGMSGSGVERVITLLLGSALIATALALVFRTRLIRSLGVRAERSDGRRTASLTVLTGMALGLLVSLTSVGAGALGVTALILLYPALPMARIVGSDIAHAVPLTLVGGIGHWLAGSVNGAILASLLVGSLPGIVAGSYAAGHVPERALRLTLAAVLLLVGGKLVF
ncbi:MAG TPA: sulfite exporter TauE/SafE family protein, partial [Stellaceae bacterium]|nr:sulfite exporter TauE/SafE family protein [Stellaceae bacterium]